MTPEQSEKGKAIDLAVFQIEKEFGKGSIMRLGTKDVLVPAEIIPTGSVSFDAALGVGGMPRGQGGGNFRPGVERQYHHCAARGGRSAETRRNGGLH